VKLVALRLTSGPVAYFLATEYGIEFAARDIRGTVDLVEHLDRMCAALRLTSAAVRSTSISAAQHPELGREGSSTAPIT
jgi:hypothetical protein